MEDKIEEQILNLINSAKEPLETKEIQQKCRNISRAKILYRLNNLRGKGLIRGKSIGAGKGTWVWWSIKSFS